MNITVRRTNGSTGSYVAYLTDNTKVFENGKNESEAVGRLVITLSMMGCEIKGKLNVDRRFG